MKRTTLIILATILLFSLSFDTSGGTRESKPDELEKMSRELLRSSKENREKAQALAIERGWLVRGMGSNGRLFELQGMEEGIPCYYEEFNNTDAAITTRTDSVQHYIGGGAGFTLGLWDGAGPRRTHQELAGRIVWGDSKTFTYGDHATHVAGTMIGAGVRPQARGMAPSASIKAFQWDDDLSEMASEAARGILISNHSYGLSRGWEYLGSWYWFGDSTISETEDCRFGFYSESSRKVDELICAAPNYLVVLSAANDRNDSVPPGTLHYFWDARYGSWRQSRKVRDNDGAPLGYDCIPNGTTLGKNVLTIGAVKPVLNYTGPASVEMTPFSSWGPTDDGRIKPDICGDGWAVYSSTAGSDTAYAYYHGTSMASPNVCGSLALLQKYYRDNHRGVPPRAATVKALAIHTAREAGPTPGPDYSYGWGLLDAYGAFRLIEADLDERLGLIEELTLMDGVPSEFHYRCDGTESELRVTIAWTDPAGKPPAPALDPPDLMLVNNLDLRIEKDGSIWEPWVLDPENPSAPATTGNNFRDNAEQVLVENPEAGIYVIRVSNDGPLQGGIQDFSLVVSGAKRTNTWHVYADGTGDAPTIAAAIDSAGADDQILVYPGVHRERDILVDKPLTIKGIRGAEITHVDAQRLGRCFELPAGAGSVRIEGLTLKNGSVQGRPANPVGGAVYSCNEKASIVSCIITGSTAARGGGLFIEGGLAELKRCRISSNTATESGGGIYVNEAECPIEFCVIAGNKSFGRGGGLYANRSSLGVTGCTIAHNSAAGNGGGMYFSDYCWSTVSRTIVAFTYTGEGVFRDGGSGIVQLSCCNLFANAGGTVGGTMPDPFTGGNFAFDPQFCDAARFDYSIGDGSRCRPEGNPCGVLIGALIHKCHTKTMWYVKADGTGDEPTIQAAVNRAAAGDTILLAPGTYTGTGNTNVTFGGKNLVVRSQEGRASTIIDCGALSGLVRYGFYYSEGEDTTAVLEGITVRHAMLGAVRCDGASPIIKKCAFDSCITNGTTPGGGLNLDKSSSPVLGCVLTNNKANPSGGAIYTKEYKGRIEDCTIVGNTAVRFGGGVVVHSGSNTRIVRCTVDDNRATGDTGGGIYIVSARAVIDSCTITRNSGTFGGGVYNGISAYCTLRNSVISKNTAGTGGGGVFSNTNLTMDNCTVTGNSAGLYGGGVESFSAALNPISRSIIAFNQSASGIYTVSGVQAISCSDVYGNVGGNYAGSTPDQTGLNNNFSVDPGFCGAGVSNYAIYDTSRCAPAHSPCGALVGARGVGCRIAPNLAIETADFDRQVLPATDILVVSVVVRNTGVVDADSFHIDFYADRNAAPSRGEVGDRRILVPFLAVGDTVVWSVPALTSDTIGGWRSWLVVDSDDRIAEMDEADNASGPHAVAWIAPRKPGWPVAAALCGTSPLLVDLDGDASTLEIVVGCGDGRLHAWSAAGGPLDGWPVTLGSAVRSTPAGGDIAGDSRNEIVVGCDDGKIYAFDYLGRKLWESATSGPIASTPALADLDGDGKMEILCGTAGYLHALEGDGYPFAGAWPLNLGTANAGSPAVGDVDGDGGVEIAVVGWTAGESPLSLVYLLDPDGSPYGAAWPLAVDSIVCADPVIGDVAGDHSRLEIVCAGMNGVVYVWNADGTPCFAPVRVRGMVESSPALSDIDDDGYLDVAVTSRRWSQQGETGFWEGFASVIGQRGGIIASRKVSQQADDAGAFPGAICIGEPREVVAGTPDGALRALAADWGAVIAGRIAAAPAAGDIDGDGWVEIFAVASDDSIHCFELRTGAVPVDQIQWPLLRRNAARTGYCGHEPVSGIDEKPEGKTPVATSLRSIYPNPFNPTARITFEIATRSRVTLAIFDIAGREVAVILDRSLDPGRHEAVWNGRTASGRAAASGVYFCRLRAGDAVETKKMILMR